MKVIHTIAEFGEKSGGTSTCTYDLLTAMHDLASDTEVELITTNVSNESDRIMGNGEKWIQVLPNDFRTPVKFSSHMIKALVESDADVYHTNGMWLHTNHITCSEARAKHKPYVITPHGMLYPEALRRSRWKKWPMLELWFRRDIMKASCIHVTCEDELRHMRSFGYGGPVALIGNPVPVSADITDIVSTRTESLDSVSNLPKKLGFLGRLHPRKNVEAFLNAIALQKNANIEAVIMGSGDEAYERFLRNEADRLGIAHCVEFAGFVSGRRKFERLAELSALFVPSDMENFGMIIPEALLVGTPVMASLGTPWKQLNDNGCGWWTDNSPESIAKVIDNVTSLTALDIFNMGIRGREMVLQHFEAHKVATQMLELYHWLAGETAKPDFVH